MRNDARPIGHDLPDDPVGGTRRSGDDRPAPSNKDALERGHVRRDRTADVVNRGGDTDDRRSMGDRELAMPAADATLNTKL
jgi:hypothetical protein